MSGTRRVPPHVQLADDLKAVLALPQGRRYLWALVEFCGVRREGWSPSAEVHRLSGMRAVGLKIMGDIQAVRPELVTIPLELDSQGLNDNDDEEDTDA